MREETCFWKRENSLPPELSPASHQGCPAQLVAHRDEARKVPSGKAASWLLQPLPPSASKPVRSYLALSWPPPARAAGINFSTLNAKLLPSLPLTQPRLPLTAFWPQQPPSPRTGEKDALTSAQEEEEEETRRPPPPPSPDWSRKWVTVMQKKKN